MPSHKIEAVAAVVLGLRIDWLAVARAVVWPQLSMDHQVFLTVVAVLGTTISPYLFFWQASQEVEDKKPGVHSAEEVRFHLARIRTDTVIGMGFSELVAVCIMLSTAATLYAAGVRDVETAAQAAEALRPVAGDFAFLVFGLGIIGSYVWRAVENTKRRPLTVEQRIQTFAPKGS